jgi:hypothetical protein
MCGPIPLSSSSAAMSLYPFSAATCSGVAFPTIGALALAPATREGRLSVAEGGVQAREEKRGTYEDLYTPIQEQRGDVGVAMLYRHMQRCCTIARGCCDKGLCSARPSGMVIARFLWGTVSISGGGVHRHSPYLCPAAA